MGLEELDGSGEGEVGVRYAEGGGGDFGEVRLDYDCGSFGGAGQGDVFRVGDEGDVSGAGGVDGGYGCDFGGGVGTCTGMEVSAEAGG